ncbi:MAG: hypothetical protein JO345_30905 [Streptosporangiaceae bacterium]|nr:hypothetical protein [Streptosporangiaceae bacterium]
MPSPPQPPGDASDDSRSTCCGISYSARGMAQQRAIWLTRDELLAMITGLRDAIAPLLDNPATSDRTRYLISPIMYPAEKPSPG